MSRRLGPPVVRFNTESPIEPIELDINNPDLIKEDIEKIEDNLVREEYETEQEELQLKQASEQEELIRQQEIERNRLLVEQKEEELKREKQERERKRLEREQREADRQKQKEENERKKREENERKRREENERKQREREENERIKREESERKQREREENERMKREENERKQREREEYERVKREENERKQREKEENEIKQREEDERKQREENERRSKKDRNHVVTAKSYQSLIDQTNAESELKKYCYDVDSVVVAKEDKDYIYMKCTDRRGHKVFVLIDTLRSPILRDDKLVLIENKMAKIIPHSTKRSSFSMAIPDVSGVAIQDRDDRICMLSFDEELKEREVNLTLLEDSAPKSVTVEYSGEQISYPVVKLSEIRANPLRVLNNTEIVTRRLRGISYESAYDDFAEFCKRFTELSFKLKGLDESRVGYVTQITNTTKPLLSAAKRYESYEQMSEFDCERYDRIRKELAYRSGAVEALLRGMQKINKHIEQINDIICNVEGVNAYFSEDSTRISRTVID